MFKWIKKILYIFKKKNNKINETKNVVRSDSLISEDLEKSIAIESNNNFTDNKETSTSSLMPSELNLDKDDENNFKELSDNSLSIEDSTSIDSIQNNKSILFNEEEINSIVNILRPLIKNINFDNNYIEFCSSVIKDNAKRLKTFAKVSDDYKTIDIRFTQSPSFNIALTDFIDTYVADKFKNAIEDVMPKTYGIMVNDGVVIIYKLGKI